MAPARSVAPVLPVDISQSPLLAAGILPDELFAALAGPLPTITIGSPTIQSPRLGAGRRGVSRSPRYRDPNFTKPRSKPSSPLVPTAPIPPKQVDSLLALLEDMQNDVAAEVQRVRLSIQETRRLVRACREDSAARESARLQRAKAEES